MYMRRSDNRAARHGRTSIVRANPGRRRASVLVFVVALLGLLFIAGAAFLRSVTFEAQSIAIESKVQAGESLIDTLEAQIFAALEQSFLGPEGPYTLLNSNLPVVPDPILPGVNYVIGPLYGELDGLSPILSSIEPFLNSGGDLEFDTTTQFDLMVASQSAPLPVYPPPPGFGLVPAVPGAIPGQPDVDADGNGIVDSRVVYLTSTLGALPPFAFIPPHILDPVAKELNNAGTGTNLGLALRIVSNSGMANLNYSHPFLVKNVLVDNALDTTLVNLVNAPYEPRMEESTLRYRTLLPPRVLPSSVLHGRPDDPENLGDLVGILFPPGETNSDYRWWAFDISDAGPTADWYRRMDSEFMDPLTGDYDRRHLVTTVSSDDLLIRSDLVTPTNDPLLDATTYNLDWTGVILDEYDNSPAAQGAFPIQYDLDVSHNMQPGTSVSPYPTPTDYAYDAYPAGLPIDDPRKGRVQLSLDWIQNQLLTLDSSGALLTGTTGVNRINPDIALRTDPESIAAVRLIQDAFTLMLRNHLGSGSFVPIDIPLTAASLTANLIDYADTDGIPTAVAVRGSTPVTLDGVVDPTSTVYGLEQQPYITELFTMLENVNGPDPPLVINSSTSVSAIELYNAYSGAPLDLGLYDLVIRGGTFDGDGDIGPGIYRLSNFGLPPLSPNASIVLHNGNPFGPPEGTPTGGFPLVVSGVPWVLDSNSVVELVRNDIVGGVVVDRAVVPPGFPGGYGTIVFPPDAGRSLQRDMFPSYVPTLADAASCSLATSVCGHWRVTVPDVGDKPGHTLGLFNTHTNTAKYVHPVQADFDNFGSLTLAFPTTGSMMLLMRHANTALDPFTAWLTGAAGLNPAGDESTEIDNGRMPVFDEAESYHSSATTPGGPFPATQIVDGLNALPWGQYIFDYFTALPLDVSGDPLLPTVEEFGARVHGRININAAPWKVLEGLPLIAPDQLPAAFMGQVADTIDPSSPACPGGCFADSAEMWIGPELAQAIVAYRELRNMPAAPASGAAQSGDYGAATFRGVGDNLATMRRGRGFLTVGELLEVRHTYWDGDYVNRIPRVGANDPGNGDLVTLWRMDSGVVGRSTGGVPANQDYVSAIALMVSLGDWVTTRSHVFTVYGTVSGNAPTNNEIRFQETVDRLPALLDGTGPERIGERIVEE